VKDNNRIVLFILDPNGVQVPLWYKKYMKAFNFWNTAHVSHSQIIFNSFNEKILQVLNVYITKRYPNTYSISTETETNINEFKLNFTGNNEYQVGGYCALFCVLFIHVIYNNINVHNRDVF
jgi:dimeric dUTPase (all-alpha-NTP-PPase superfamily)